MDYNSPPPKPPAQVEAAKKKILDDLRNRMIKYRQKGGPVPDGLRVKPFGRMEGILLVGSWTNDGDREYANNFERNYALQGSKCVATFYEGPTVYLRKEDILNLDSMLKTDHTLSTDEIRKVPLGFRRGLANFQVDSAKVCTSLEQKEVKMIIVQGVWKKSKFHQMVVLVPHRYAIYEYEFSSPSREDYEKHLPVFQRSIESVWWSFSD